MQPEQIDFLQRAAEEASHANHLFPKYAACEAALESAFGRSKLAAEDNNLFGMKQHSKPTLETVTYSTVEYVNGQPTTINANFIKYPNWASCFQDRMSTLVRLAPNYPHYAAALDASNGETFVREVSQTWSTDPHRAEHILDIYRQWQLPQQIVV